MTDHIYKQISHEVHNKTHYTNLKIYGITTLLTISKGRTTLKLGTVSAAWEHNGTKWELTDTSEDGTGFRTKLETLPNEPDTAYITIPGAFAKGYNYEPEIKAHIPNNHIYLECRDFRHKWNTRL